MQRRALRCLDETDIMYNRITGARLTSPISGVVQLSPKQVKKLERVQADQAETRERLRELAQESLIRRPLKALGGDLFTEQEPWQQALHGIGWDLVDLSGEPRIDKKEGGRRVEMILDGLHSLAQKVLKINVCKR